MNIIDQSMTSDESVASSFSLYNQCSEIDEKPIKDLNINSIQEYDFGISPPEFC